MRYRKIPDEAVRRLSIYLRRLLFLAEQGQESVSSNELAELLGVNPAQIRKDFSYFGVLGKPGVGYKTEKLVKQIKQNLRLDVAHRTALVGVGNLGLAVLAYAGFRMYGLDIVAAFDTNRKKIGTKAGELTIEDASDLRTLRRRKIDFAIIAVPASAAQGTADALVKAGIRGILNFSPYYIVVPKRVKVISIDIAMELARLPYYIG